MPVMPEAERVVERHLVDGAMRHELVRLFRGERLSMAGERPPEQRGRKQHKHQTLAKTEHAPLASLTSVTS